MTGHSSLKSDGLWVVAGRALIMLTGATANILLAHSLSARDMRDYFLVLSIIAPIAVLARLGLDQAALRGVAAALGTGDVTQVRRVVKGVVCWGTLGIAGTSAVLLCLGHAFGQPPFLTILATLWAATVAAEGLLSEILRGFKDIRAATLYGGVIPSILSCTLLLAAIVLLGDLDLHTAIGACVAAGTVSISCEGWQVAQKLRSCGISERHFASPVGSHILCGSWPILINNLILVTAGQADIWLLTACRPAREVAVYGVVTRLAGLVVLPQYLAWAVISPRIAELYAQAKRDELEVLVRRAATLAGIVALVAFSVIAAAGKPLLAGLYGHAYGTGSVPLVFLSFGQLIAVLAGLSGTTLVMSGSERVVMATSLLCRGLAVSAAFLLVRRSGMVGLGAAVAAGIVIQNLALLLWAKSRLGIWTHAGLARTWKTRRGD